MSLVDDIAEVIRSASINDIDMAFAERIDPKLAYEGLETKPGYEALIGMMLTLFESAASAGVPRERAAATVLGVHEDIVRYVVTKAVRARFGALNPDVLTALNARDLHEWTKREIASAEEGMHTLEKKKLELAAEQPTDNFRSYLLYAADKFARTPEEKQVITAVAGRIMTRVKRKRRDEKVH